MLLKDQLYLQTQTFRLEWATDLIHAKSVVSFLPLLSLFECFVLKFQP